MNTDLYDIRRRTSASDSPHFDALILVAKNKKAEQATSEWPRCIRRIPKVVRQEHCRNCSVETTNSGIQQQIPEHSYLLVHITTCEMFTVYETTSGDNR